MAGGVFKRFLELVLDTDSAKKLERDTQRALKKSTDPKAPVAQLGTIERGMNKLKIAAVGVGVAVVAGVAAGFRKMVKESSEAQAATAQLEAVLRSTGGAAGRTVGQLEDMANALQKTTTFSDDAVKGAQALLLTFTKIRGDTFDSATKAILNVSTALGSDLNSAALQVGKALNDPIKGISALTRVGVSFSQAQKDVIRGLVETNDLAGAQAVILRELEVEFGGSAEAARDTLGGALAGLNNAWGDLFEVSRDSSTGIVRAINDISDALPKLGGRLDSALAAFQRFWDGTRRIREKNMRNWLGRDEAADALLLDILGREGDIGVAGPPRGARPPLPPPVDAAAAKARAAELEAAFLLAGQRAIVLAQTLNRAIYGIQSDARLGSPAQMATEGMRQQVEAGLAGLKVPLTLSPTTRAPNLEVLREGADGLAGAFFENFDTIQSAAQMAALGMQSAFQDAFSALGEEGNAFANLFGSLFEGMASAVLSSIAQVASVKVGENVAKALAAAGDGFLGHPGGFPAAAKYLASAAAWAALGGAAGAAAASVGGGGSFRGTDVVGRQIDKLDRAGDIIIYVDGVDPKNPRHQALIGKTAAEYRQRSGTK